MLAFPKLIQLSQMECGPTALRIVAKYYGKHISSIKAQELCFLSCEGSSLLNLSNAAENIGFRTRAVKLNLEKPYITICRNCYISICRFWYIVIFRLHKRKPCCWPGCPHRRPSARKWFKSI